MKNYSSPFSVIEVKENEKKKGKNYYQVIVSEGARVKRSWRTLKQSRAFTRVRGNAESDRIGSRRFPVLPLVFFLCIADNPTGELSGRGKTITFSTSPPRRAQARYDGQGKIAHGGTDDWIGTKLRYGANFLRLRGRYPFSSLYESHARASHDSSLPFQRLSDR